MTNDENYIKFFYDLFYRLLNFGEYAFKFLTRDIEIGGYNFNVLGLLVGGGFVAFWIMKLIKDYVPLA